MNQGLALFLSSIFFIVVMIVLYHDPSYSEKQKDRLLIFSMLAGFFGIVILNQIKNKLIEKIAKEEMAYKISFFHKLNIKYAIKFKKVNLTYDKKKTDRIRIEYRKELAKIMN